MARSKWNEGSIIEGIFALAAGVYIKNGKIQGNVWKSSFTTKEVQDLRKLINPTEWEKGASIIQLVKTPIKLQSSKKPTDEIKKIQVSIRLKPGEGAGGFGKIIDYNPKSIQDKINTLSILFPKLSVGTQLSGAINKLLTNNRSDYMHWYITADGVGGEQSGGTIKADVTIKLIVEYYKNKQLISSKKENITFNYSLKSDSKTWANLAPWRSTLELIEQFGLDTIVPLTETTVKQFATAAKTRKEIINALTWPPKNNDTDDIKNQNNFKVKIPSKWSKPSSKIPNCYVMLTSANTESEKKLKQTESLKTVAALHELIKLKFDSVKTSSSLNNFSSLWWNFLYESGAGTDAADIIDVRAGTVYQVQAATLRRFVDESKQGTNYLLSKITLERGNVIIFYVINPANKKEHLPVFSLRMRAEYRASKGKLFTKFLFEYEPGIKKLNTFEKHSIK